MNKHNEHDLALIFGIAFTAVTLSLVFVSIHHWGEWIVFISIPLGIGSGLVTLASYVFGFFGLPNFRRQK